METLPQQPANLQLAQLAQLLCAQQQHQQQQAQPPSVIVPPPSASFPTQLTNPLLPQIMQQQMLNIGFLQLVQSMLAKSSLASSSPAPLLSPIDETIDYGSVQPTTVAAGPGVPGPAADRQLVVPNDDKEGWCRNKKYIEKMPTGGFMCLVCKKIYGRYNSVSYHVTIYHRNPPIRCDIDGCDFTTREARYIHFHKYYRHGIGLPRNIDQGSRRCTFCKHIAKSPAMLEKHMKRHGETAWSLYQQEKALECSEGMLEEGRARTLSECPSTATTEMEVDEEEFDVKKPRSFTL